MKIEMGESLVRSWLRHCKACQVAELNWKPSPTWEVVPSAHLAGVFRDARSRFPDAIKQTLSIGQFLRQAEIDVLGVRLGAGGRVERLFGVDTAFHSNGLSYGGNEDTKNRLQKKFLRTALVLESCFPEVPIEVLFVAPVVTPRRLEFAREAAQEVKDFYPDRGKVTFDLLGPEAFREKILEPVLKLHHKVADTSELFLRAWQLVAPHMAREPGPQGDGPGRNPKVVRPSPRGRAAGPRDRSDKHDAHIVAYYLSKFDHERLQLGNQGETFAYAAKVLGVKANTIKNARDYFDSHTGSHRQGWKAPLPPRYMEVHQAFRTTPEPELRELVKGILKVK